MAWSGRSRPRSCSNPRSPSTTTSLPRLIPGRAPRSRSLRRRRAMSAESVIAETESECASVRLRADRPGWIAHPRELSLIRGLILIVLAVGFVLIGGGDLDLGPIEARIGIAAGEPLG